jgi:hypothetical protein
MLARSDGLLVNFFDAIETEAIAALQDGSDVAGFPLVLSVATGFPLVLSVKPLGPSAHLPCTTRTDKSHLSHTGTASQRPSLPDPL